MLLHGATAGCCETTEKGRKLKQSKIKKKKGGELEECETRGTVRARQAAAASGICHYVVDIRRELTVSILILSDWQEMIKSSQLTCVSSFSQNDERKRP